MADIAILAPVPFDLLEDAIAEGKTTVAFGSMAFDFFRSLQADYPDEPIDALIYASHRDEFTLQVEWQARYLRWEDAVAAEGDPDFLAKFRTKVAMLDWAGNEDGGRWAIYWTVEGLHRLETPIAMSALRLPDGRKLSAAFIPHGPTRIQPID